MKLNSTCYTIYCIECLPDSPESSVTESFDTSYENTGVQIENNSTSKTSTKRERYDSISNFTEIWSNNSIKSEWEKIETHFGLAEFKKFLSTSQKPENESRKTNSFKLKVSDEPCQNVRYNHQVQRKLRMKRESRDEFEKLLFVAKTVMWLEKQ